MSSHSHYNKRLRPLAQQLRNDSTRGEVVLWDEVLKQKRFWGYQFNRQYAIDHYIVDFICRKLKLIVEVDGRSHQFKIEEDAVRDAHLEKLGYRVVRFSEWEVKHDLYNVIRVLESYLQDEGNGEGD